MMEYNSGLSSVKELFGVGLFWCLVCPVLWLFCETVLGYVYHFARLSTLIDLGLVST